MSTFSSITIPTNGFGQAPDPLVVGFNSFQGQEYAIYLMFDFRPWVGSTIPLDEIPIILNSVSFSIYNRNNNPSISLDFKTSNQTWSGTQLNENEK